MESKITNPRKMNLRDLESIKKVDTPPFLWTRIESRISNFVEERLTNKQVALYLTGIAILITVNIFIFKYNTSSSTSNSLADQLELVNSNQFYQ